MSNWERQAIENGTTEMRWVKEGKPLCALIFSKDGSVIGAFEQREGSTDLQRVRITKRTNSYTLMNRWRNMYHIRKKENFRQKLDEMFTFSPSDSTLTESISGK